MEDIVKAVDQIESKEELILVRDAFRKRFKELRHEESKFTNWIERNKAPLKKLAVMLCVLFGLAMFGAVANTSPSDFGGIPTITEQVTQDVFTVTNAYLEFAASFVFLLLGMMFGASILGQTIVIMMDID